ncbi:membrane protein insertion efficiency factor YidD [Patescibacteria group bacterium]
MKKVILKAIRSYQKRKKSPIGKVLYLSDASCRFTPTCSEYSYQAIEKYGILKGGLLSLKRIFKCHPFNKGGHDPL